LNQVSDESTTLLHTGSQNFPSELSDFVNICPTATFVMKKSKNNLHTVPDIHRMDRRCLALCGEPDTQYNKVKHVTTYRSHDPNRGLVCFAIVAFRVRRVSCYDPSSELPMVTSKLDSRKIERQTCSCLRGDACPELQM
jgi:hypothetical protein